MEAMKYRPGAKSDLITDIAEPDRHVIHDGPATIR
jgi:hypothetical protein